MLQQIYIWPTKHSYHIYISIYISQDNLNPVNRERNCPHQYPSLTSANQMLHSSRPIQTSKRQ